MKRIPLTQGKFALVDDEDYEFLTKFRWHCNSEGYATADIRMHRLVMMVDKMQRIDHRNRDKLDNRRENLRLCTLNQNQWNRSRKKSGNRYVGAYRTRRGNYKAVLCQFGKDINLGHFADDLTAAMAYDLWAMTLRGDYAVTNFKPVLFGP